MNYSNWGMQSTYVNLTDTLGLSSPPCALSEELHIERIYNDNFPFNIGMLNYCEPPAQDYTLDLDDVLYGDPQIQQFLTNKFVKVLRPECYEYLFTPEKTQFERWAIEQAGFTAFVEPEPVCELRSVILAPSSNPLESIISRNQHNC
jgi:hypothetical protein